ncbi:MAG: hypothetical protein LAN70_13760 [Acidobacteriia bacterium]|nr:hypothetical protein [Terriglobia bacterium]
MKLNLRHAVWALALAFAVTVLSAPAIAAAYQSEQGLEHGRGHDNDKNNDNAYANNPNYQQGLKHGQEDRDNHRALRYRVHPNNDADRRAYEFGYNQAYQGHGTYQGRPGQRGPTGNRPYGNDVQRLAYDNGFKTGLDYGRADRNNGHSNRPTYSSTYQNGTSGYNSSMGSETAYKNAFREGYRAGYAEGYNAGGRRR